MCSGRDLHWLDLFLHLTEPIGGLEELFLSWTDSTLLEFQPVLRRPFPPGTVKHSFITPYRGSAPIGAIVARSRTPYCIAHVHGPFIRVQVPL